jgi:hypothetical protein
MPDSFNSVPFTLVIPHAGTIDQRPLWIDRHVTTKPAITSKEVGLFGVGALALLRARTWRSITLDFRQQNHPAALISQAMLDAFVAGWLAGGTHTLSLESVSRTVIFDPRQTVPVQVSEQSPTGAADVPGTRLYEGTVFLIELLSEGSPTYDTFNGVQFKLGDEMMIPRWVDRHYQAAPRLGSVEFTIQGRVALQEMTAKWRPVTLEFNGSANPPSFITQAMLDALVSAMTTGGTHTLVIEGSTKSVIFDWRNAAPVEVVERSPFRLSGVPGTRLYEGVVRLVELLP